jgi:hypothetical protein
MRARRTLIVVLASMLTAALAVLTPATATAAGYSVEVRNCDGRAEIFFLQDNQLWHYWEFTPGARDYSQPQALGGSGRLVYFQITAERNLDCRLEVFGVGTNAQMYHIWQFTPGGNWSSFHSMGGRFDGPPTVGKNKDGRLEVFAVGETRAMYHAWQTSPGGAWTGWRNMGDEQKFAPALQSPQVGAYPDGALWVRALGAGLEFQYYKYQLTPGGAWYPHWIQQ